MSNAASTWSGAGLDADGYICQLHPEGPLQSTFLPVIRAAIQQLAEELEDRLHSLYLYGSVARREAVPGQSDLDLTILTRGTVAGASLDRVQARLETAHADIAKVDFDVGTYAEAVDPENRFGWGFWLRHCCVNIYGPDVGARFERFAPDLRIAIAINGDVGVAADDYAHWLADAKTDAERTRLQQEAAKKILRSMASLLTVEANCWVTDMERAAQLACTYFPKQAGRIEVLHRMAQGERLAMDEARAAVLDAGHWTAERFAEIRAE